MAKKSLIAKAARPQKYKTRAVHAAATAAGARAPSTSKFGLCRICLRELAHEGVIPGMTKSSW